MSSTINLNSLGFARTAREIQVWTRAKWSDPWTLRPEITAVQCVWSAAPDVSTAALEYRYGLIIPPGAGIPVTLDPITTRGYWVLIRWRSDEGGWIDWLGSAETPVTRDHIPARGGLPQTGKQTIRCTGLMRALQQCFVRSTVYLGEVEGEPTAIRSSGTGAVFNAGMRGNRSGEKHQLDGSGSAAYVFVGPREGGFLWRTRDIVEHLHAFHLPTPSSVAVDGGVPWQLADVDQLSDWDRPVLPSDSRDVASLIGDLLVPSRLSGWTVAAVVSGDEVPVVSSVAIVPFSGAATPVNLPGGVIRANKYQANLLCDRDPLTTVIADADASGVVDQVIVEGPREVTIGMLSADGEAEAFRPAWSTEEEQRYRDGAKDAEGWADLELSEKRRMNEDVRKRGDELGNLADVYSLFVIKPDWNWEAEGGPWFVADEPGEDGEPAAYRPCPWACEFIDDYLPIYAGNDFSGPAEDVLELWGGKSLMRPLWFYKTVGGAGELFAMFRQDSLAMDKAEAPYRDFDLVPTFEEGPAVRIRVGGAPQHAIAGGDWVGNDADVDQFTVFGDWPVEGWRVTTGIIGDRRPFYAVPGPAAVAGLDVVRRRLFTFDDDWLLSVRIIPGTVLGFDKDGQPQVSDGGLLRDPASHLRSIAEAIWAQLGQPRYVATVTTGRRLGGFRVGGMLGFVDAIGRSIDAPVSSITLDAPLSEDGGQRSAIMQTIRAAAYQADVQELLRR